MTDVQPRTLTYDEIEILIKALDVWATKPSADEAFGSVVQAIFRPNEGKEAFKAQLEANMDKARRETEFRRAQTIRLQAKLLDMRDSMLEPVGKGPADSTRTNLYIKKDPRP